MIRVLEENGSAEAATSPSHGSNNPTKENAVNDHSHNTAPAGAARVPFDYHAAYSGLEELICTAQARGNVLCLLSDGLMSRDQGSSHVRVPVLELDSLLFMIEEMRRAVGALDQQYKASWPAEAASIVDALTLAKEAKADREREETELCNLIWAHRAATISWEASRKANDRSEPSADEVELERARKERWEEASAALLSWRPSTFAGNADRIRYLTHDEHGIWKACKPTEDELNMLFASMAEVGHGQ